MRQKCIANPRSTSDTQHIYDIHNTHLTMINVITRSVHVQVHEHVCMVWGRSGINFARFLTWFWCSDLRYLLVWLCFQNTQHAEEGKRSISDGAFILQGKLIPSRIRSAYIYIYSYMLRIYAIIFAAINRVKAYLFIRII